MSIDTSSTAALYFGKQAQICMSTLGQTAWWSPSSSYCSSRDGTGVGRCGFAGNSRIGARVEQGIMGGKCFTAQFVHVYSVYAGGKREKSSHGGGASRCFEKLIPPHGQSVDVLPNPHSWLFVHQGATCTYSVYTLHTRSLPRTWRENIWHSRSKQQINNDDDAGRSGAHPADR